MKLPDKYLVSIKRNLDMGDGKHLYCFQTCATGSCLDKYNRWLESVDLLFKKDGIYKEYHTEGIGSWYKFEEYYLPKEWEEEIKQLF